MVRDPIRSGIDGHFENVGRGVLDAVMLCMKPFGRIAVYRISHSAISPVARTVQFDAW